MQRCKICKSKKSKLIYKVAKYELFNCLECQVAYLFPEPSIYSTKLTNLKMYDSKKVIKEYFKVRKMLNSRAKKCVKVLKEHKKNGKLLDVGCSYGFYLDVFQKHGYETTGIDISSKAISYVRSYIKTKGINDRFENHYFARKSFDIITLIDVLEHSLDPNKIISKCNRILRNNGIIIIQTPNFNSIISRLTGSKWIWLLLPQHVFLYSAYSLIFLLIQHGFRILHISTWDDDYEFIRNLLLIIGISDKKGIKRFLYKIFIKLEFIVGLISFLWNKFYLGGEIIVYAQKKQK